jgi:tetratricopeptide (TPR) repeat protein
MLPDDEALSRQADALWLAGYTGNARNIWTMLTATRAVYNLALTSQTPEESVEQLKLLIERGSADDVYRQWGIIRYSRQMEAPAAVTFLETERPQASVPIDALFDLEILKRRTELGEPARLIAETWLLLDKYPDLEALYQWGAWYFELQRSHTEIDFLLRTAARHNFSGYWKGIHEALQHIREGNFSAAEDKLSVILTNNDDWIAAVNLGRSYEARLSPLRALESYEKAFAAIMESVETENSRLNTASRIQVRIAHCLRTLGRFNESRQALNYALELNPDNLNARLELGRLE